MGAVGEDRHHDTVEDHKTQATYRLVDLQTLQVYCSFDARSPGVFFFGKGHEKP